MRLHEIDRHKEILHIAQTYRRHIEQDGYKQLRGRAMSSNVEVYRRFEGLCNVASRQLARIYRDHGFPATTKMMEYRGSDLKYWQRHGAALYQTEEEFEDADPWEIGEAHEVVRIGDIIVDVTSDQFNMEHPEQHEVVVTKVGDRRYT